MVVEDFKGRYSGLLKSYIQGIKTGEIPAGEYLLKAIVRFERMLKEEDYDIKEEEATVMIDIIQAFTVFSSGEDADGLSLSGRNFQLLPYQIFIIYSTFIFYKKDTDIRVVKHVFISMARKNGKTEFISNLAYALALRDMWEGKAPIGIMSSSLSLTAEFLGNIKQNVLRLYDESEALAKRDGWRFADNSGAGNYIKNHCFQPSKSQPKGVIDIKGYTVKRNSTGNQGLRKKYVFMDELHDMDHAETNHTAMLKSMQNYSNSLSFTTTTAGIGLDHYCNDYIEFCKDILDKNEKEDDHICIFIAQANVDRFGEVDLYDRRAWYEANPSLGFALQEEVIEKELRDSQISEKKTTQFLAFNLNLYQSEVVDDFEVEYFITSDKNIKIDGTYDEILEYLLKKELTWYGGADLSQRGDLTASCLYAEDDEGITYIIPHAFIPYDQIELKESQGRMDVRLWEKQGFMTFCYDKNSQGKNVISYEDVVSWFIKMRSVGFKIGQIGIDKSYAQSFLTLMIDEGFDVYQQSQRKETKTRGFIYLEEKALDEKIYFMHSDLYKYCLQNLTVDRRNSGLIEYYKKGKELKIDVFEASLFGALRYTYFNSQQEIEKKKEAVNIANYYRKRRQKRG